MANEANAELTEWSTQLNTLTPRGFLPAVGSPRRRIADYITSELQSRVRVEPTLYAREALFAANDIAQLARIAEETRPVAQEHVGRLVADAPASALQVFERAGVRSRLVKDHGVELGLQDEALFLYYQHRHWAPLHLDDQVKYEFNLLTMLHRKRGAAGSTTCTYFLTQNGVTARDLEIGESLFFHASYTPHGRPPLGDGEEVVLFATGLGL